eukprot:TRINITY_DN76622_c0_g1_i1.p1 TRINITY_DN76622_c0_g1~~TRINITY_DN76622_c0_g1_i1.p1  ORF type:complete len:269 (+),score=26.92 TRINITY_DN76622_c0_g1_i1:44-808(+)
MSYQDRPPSRAAHRGGGRFGGRGGRGSSGGRARGFDRRRARDESNPVAGPSARSMVRSVADGSAVDTSAPSAMAAAAALSTAELVDVLREYNARELSAPASATLIGNEGGSTFADSSFFVVVDPPNAGVVPPLPVLSRSKAAKAAEAGDTSATSKGSREPPLAAAQALAWVEAFAGAVLRERPPERTSLLGTSAQRPAKRAPRTRLKIPLPATDDSTGKPSGKAARGRLVAPVCVTEFASSGDEASAKAVSSGD